MVVKSREDDTAADIDRAKIAAIPGFGKGLTEKFVDWKEAKEKCLRPDHAAVVDSIEVQKIDRRLAARRAVQVKAPRDKVAGIEVYTKVHSNLKTERWANVEQIYRAILHLNLSPRSIGACHHAETLGRTNVKIRPMALAVGALLRIGCGHSQSKCPLPRC